MENQTDPSEYQCPVECPYQSDDKLALRLFNRYNRGLRQLRLFILSAIAISLIYWWQYQETGKRPGTTEVLLAFGWAIVALDRPALLTDIASKALEKIGLSKN